MLLPRLLWPLTIYEIGLSVVEKLEGKVNRYTRKWLGLPPALSSVALYSRSTSLRLPLRSTVEEYKLSKIRTQWMLNNFADPAVPEVKPLLRSGKKFRVQNEIDESVAELTFEEVRGPTQTDRHAVGWNHLPKWSQASSSTRAAMINQERRRKVEQDRVTRAVQQSQQGKWTTNCKLRDIAYSKQNVIVITKIEQDVRADQGDVIRHLPVTKEDIRRMTEEPELELVVEAVNTGRWPKF